MLADTTRCLAPFAIRFGLTTRIRLLQEYAAMATTEWSCDTSSLTEVRERQRDLLATDADWIAIAPLNSRLAEPQSARYGWIMLSLSSSSISTTSSHQLSMGIMWR